MKKIKYLLLSIFISFAFTISVSAASGSITASTSSKTVAVGSTFTVTVKVSCTDTLGSWQFGVSYDSSVISLQSGETLVVGYSQDGSYKTKSYTYKFKAIKSGTASVKITSPSMVTWDDMNTLFTPSTSGTSVTVKTQAQIEASYSKDNNLKSLSVEGYELTPEFSKDVTEYSLEVPDDVKTINVKASVNDSTARVSGTGEIDISEGANRIEVTVTAQNGAIKTYVINVDVKDLNPIDVTVNGVAYTVVKKAELLTCPTGYTASTIKINDIDVPVFKSELTKLTVLGLKDADGNITMFIYDESANTYKRYDELKGVSLTLYPMDTDSVPSGFHKTTITVNDVDINAFVSDDNDDLVIIYAMDVTTGKEGYYLYEDEDGVFMKYDEDLFSGYMDKNKEYLLYLIALGCISGILFLLSLALASKNSKLKKLLLKYSQSNTVRDESDSQVADEEPTNDDENTLDIEEHEETSGNNELISEEEVSDIREDSAEEEEPEFENILDEDDDLFSEGKKKKKKKKKRR